MILTDTHTHLYLPGFDHDRDEAVARALAAGVEKMIMPNIDSSSFPSMMNLARLYPGVCIPMIGLHPTSVKKDYGRELDFIVSATGTTNFAAVGETGIDLYWDTSTLELQVESFRFHIELALRLNLPIVIHARESFDVIFGILDDYRRSGIRGVFHAFTGTLSDLEKVRSLGFMVGIGGIVTFRNSGLAGVITETPIDSVVLETDSPYLAPVPYRGKRNESAWLTEINNRIASIYGITPEEAAAITTENAMRLFNI
jgi:TatD DNase family protein